MPDPVASPALDDAAAEAVLDALAPMLGLAVAPEWRPAVVANLRTNAAIAALVLDVPLDDAVEPAPVFRA